MPAVLAALADASAGDIDVLFILIAVLAFLAAVWCAVVGRLAAAAALVVVAIIVLIFA